MLVGLAKQQGDKLKVFAMVSGTIGEAIRGDYNPDEGNGNLYTKFTIEMMEELLKIILRFDSE